MRPIEVYKTYDGRYFEDERKAEEHRLNIIGELLDGFLPHDDRGNVTASDRYNILMKQLNDPDLIKKVTVLYNAITY